MPRNDTKTDWNMTVSTLNKTVLTWDDILDPDMKAITPNHWLKYEPPSLVLQYILGTIYLIIMIIGLIGNLTIILLFAT